MPITIINIGERIAISIRSRRPFSRRHVPLRYRPAMVRDGIAGAQCFLEHAIFFCDGGGAMIRFRFDCGDDAARGIAMPGDLRGRFHAPYGGRIHITRLFQPLFLSPTMPMTRRAECSTF